MKQCLRITFSMEVPRNFFEDIIQKHAQKLCLEGTVQKVGPREIKVIVCGTHEAVDEFLGTFHKETANRSIDAFQVEPFVRDRDYRGVFRIIE
jgi:acylphosphatase